MSEVDAINELPLLAAEPDNTVDTVPLIDYLVSEGRLRVVDVKLAELLTEHVASGADNSDVFNLILLLCLAGQSQHSCLNLDDVNWQNPFNLRKSDFNKAQGSTPDTVSPFSDAFDIHQAVRCLELHPSVGEQQPLNLFGTRLYFARLAGYEQTLASRLLAMSKREIKIDEAALAKLLNDYFPEDKAPQEGLDWQKVACAMAATKGFSVITGGPGTGKTTTVTKLLAILQSLYQSAPLSIKLVAPTGKAAARLSESILGAKQQLKADIPDNVEPHIPQTAQTIHRLLGVKPFTNKFKHNSSNPLHVDVLIIDEASMVDLSLMAKLIEALPARARLILLGDKDQLASVDTGSVMSDLCQGLSLGQTPSYSGTRCTELNELCFKGEQKLQPQQSSFALADCIAFLQHSYRFDAKSGIGELAFAVNTNNSGKLNYVEQEIYSGKFNDVILDYDIVTKPIEKLVQSAASHYSEYLNLIKQGAPSADIHQAFTQYQLLAAVREGDYGVNSLNLRIEKQLHNLGLINTHANNRHYLGLPIMIAQNDYQLKLFNGDIGILLHDENAQLKAVFIDEQGNERAFSPARLPAHDKVYVMTIHKSQGSEFAYTAMVLPPANQATAGINRQLVYTGITRAKQTFELLADKKVLLMAMNKSVSRASGLYERFARLS
ncbi:exodeoxyribonuclease V subunit alpha [Pseudoalteromonas sp. A601]|uniref:exodeoxyribonuclease V subunit alpha n=1 Tax=Pseudoalteromonas sp. A601 TaxID=1967839 RepID=UPI000B3C5444|nr:exodeoxyribonuclease V subunit alpha [Pseudoalteromonas sp. A601]OUS72386.1 exodeoxyribonuclease V subunit alpha [Pseudoalteromonas sp. A601]